MTMRPRRSVLYMPGSNARALDKARSLDVDALILDLEDSVAPEAKGLGREQIAAALTEGGYGHREVVVRVNALSTPWGHDDVRALAKLGADAFLFPKIDSPAQVIEAVTALDAAGAPSGTGVWIMAETPLGILNIAAIAACSPRLRCIVLGTSDLAKDLRARHSPGRIAFVTSLGLCVLAARARGLDALDGVHLDLDDEAGLAAVCEQGRDMGFDGKTLIHPAQLAIANAAFAPSVAEIDLSRRQIAAFDEAQAAGQGVAVVDGRIVENLHVATAKAILSRAVAIAAMAD